MSREKKTKPKANRPKGPTPGLQFMTGGPPPTVRCDGKTWKVGFNHQDAKARLEQLVREHVLAQARLLGGVDQTEIREDVINGRYLTFEVGWLRTINSPIGSHLYVLALLQEHQPDATIDDVKRLFIEEKDQIDDALTIITPSFCSAAAEQWAREKKLDPAKAAAVGKQMGETMLKRVQEKQAERRATPLETVAVEASETMEGPDSVTP